MPSLIFWMIHEADYSDEYLKTSTIIVLPKAAINSIKPPRSPPQLLQILIHQCHQFDRATKLGGREGPDQRPHHNHLSQNSGRLWRELKKGVLGDERSFLIIRL